MHPSITTPQCETKITMMMKEKNKQKKKKITTRKREKREGANCVCFMTCLPACERKAVITIKNTGRRALPPSFLSFSSASSSLLLRDLH
jgi:hypothetical protein